MDPEAPAAPPAEMPPAYTESERMAMFEAVSRYIKEGKSLRRACEESGVPCGSFKRWQALAAADGGGLADGRRERSGRRAAVTLTPEEIHALQQWMLKKEGSFLAALEFFSKDERCGAETRAFITGRLKAARKAEKPAVWPVSLRRAAQLPPGALEAYRGKKAVQHASVVGRYSRTIRLENGTVLPLAPGMVWTFDDYSANEPYILEYAAGKERLCRQILAGMDAGTRGWLGFLHVARELDAYNAADVLEVIRLCIESQGHVPSVIILERATWESSAVTGITIPGTDRRWGSLEETGALLQHKFTSRGKTEIENGFDILQTWMAGEAAGLGRVRGIMEEETKDLLAINKGTRRAADCGFLTAQASAALHERAARELNDRPKHFRELGRTVSADQLLAEEPFEPRPLKPEHRWLFYPVKDVATVRENGNIIKTVAGREYVFHVNGVNPNVHLPNGYRLLIAFDPARPELGCHVANRETGSANRDGWRLGETILSAAPALESAHRVDFYDHRNEASGEDDSRASWKARKGAVKTTRQLFRGILPGGKAALRTDTATNRQGDRLEIIKNAPEAPAVPETQNADRATAPDGMLTRFAGGSRSPHARKQGADSGRRLTRLKTQDNDTAFSSDDAAALEAAENAFLAGL